MNDYVAKKALEKWGIDKQLDCLVEECSELITAIQHYKRNRVSKLAIGEEIADVEVMIHQIVFYLDLKEAIELVKSQKVERLRKKLGLK